MRNRNGMSMNFFESASYVTQGCLPQLMRHNLMTHLFITLPAGAFGDQHLLVLIDDLGTLVAISLSSKAWGR